VVVVCDRCRHPVRTTAARLACVRASEFTKRMAEVAKAKKLTRRTLNEPEVAKRVAQAKTLPRILAY
jgi:hypothetical protein